MIITKVYAYVRVVVLALLGLMLPFSTMAQSDQQDLYGGTLTIGKVGVGSLVFHPLYISLGLEHEIAELIYGEGLLRLDQNGQLIEGLALPPTKNVDGREWTFRLHEGISFHDGQLLSSEDIVFTYKLYKQSRMYDPIFHRYFRNLEEVRELDDRTVRFVMKEPVFAFPTALATLPIVPRHQFEQRAIADASEVPPPAKSIGLGPFKMDMQFRRDRVILNVNSAWHQGRPYLNRVVYRFYPSSEKLQAAFVMREVDLIEVDQATSFHELKRARPDAKIQAVRPKHKAFESIFYNHTNQLLSNRYIRRALTHAIDRARILAQVMPPGVGRVAHSPVDEDFWGYGNVDRIKYNPAKALEILRKIGWQDTDRDGVLNQGKKQLQFELLFPRGSISSEKIVRIIKLNLNEIGVDVRPKPVDLKDLVQQVRHGFYEAALITQSFEPSPDDFYALFHSESIPLKFNMLGYRNRQVDRNINFLYGITERERSIPIYQQLQALISRDQPCTFLYFIDRQYIAFDPRFKNVGVPSASLNALSSWYILSTPR